MPNTYTDDSKLPNPNGQATMANSQPVALASDQSTIPVSLASVPSHAVTNAGTFAVQADVAKVNAVAINVGTGAAGTGTQRVAVASDSSIVLAAGSALAGKVGIDQTTPGTTNAVAPISGQAGVAGGSGTVGATTQRVVLATDVAPPDAIGVNLGTPFTAVANGAAVQGVASRNGSRFAVLGAPDSKNVVFSRSTTGTSSGVIAAPGANKRIVIDNVFGKTTKGSTTVVGWQLKFGSEVVIEDPGSSDGGGIPPFACHHPGAANVALDFVTNTGNALVYVTVAYHVEDSA